MHRRLAIRTRLALVFALLLCVVLAAAMSTVYLLERHEVRLRLIADGARAAAALAQAEDGSEGQAAGGDEGDARDGPDQGDAEREARVRAYLGRRAGSDLLLLLDRGRGRPLANAAAARELAHFEEGIPRDGRSVRLHGTGYLVVARRSALGSVALAAVPTREAAQETSALLRSLLLVGGAGLLASVAIGWLAAGRALLPLKRIAERASEVTAGDLSVRVGADGARGANDEVASVAAAIDAMLERLEAAFGAQERFLHDASHELRTPLTIARGQLEAAQLGDPPDDAELRQAVELAIAELDRMGRLVDGLLQLASAGAASRRDAATLVPLHDIAERALERARPLGSCLLALRDETDGAATVLANPEALEQIVLNLVANAVRHTTVDGRVDVVVRQDETRVALDVLDDGDGVSEALLPYVFDRFTRGDDARRRATGGTGLGLAISRDLARANGGELTAVNRCGGGAAFTLTLPRAAHGKPV